MYSSRNVRVLRSIQQPEGREAGSYEMLVLLYLTLRRHVTEGSRLRGPKRKITTKHCDVNIWSLCSYSRGSRFQYWLRDPMLRLVSSSRICLLMRLRCYAQRRGKETFCIRSTAMFYNNKISTLPTQCIKVFRVIVTNTDYFCKQYFLSNCF